MILSTMIPPRWKISFHLYDWFSSCFPRQSKRGRINVRGGIVGNVKKTCCSLCILVWRPYTWRPYILLYAGHIYSYIPVLHTLICRSYILLYVGLTYSYMSVLHTLICRSYILLNVSPLYSNMSMLYTVICQLPTLPYSLNDQSKHLFIFIVGYILF